MSIQTSRIRKIDVGAPPSSLSKDTEWEMVEVHYHNFENLTTARGEAVVSPDFTCLGNHWCLRVFPGGMRRSEDGMVGISLYNLSDMSIKIQFGIAIKDKGRKVKNDSLSPDEGNEFAPYGTVIDADNRISYSWGESDFCKRTQLIDNLIEGTLIIEVRLKNIGETTNSPFIPENPFAKNILSMFNDRESSDVVFEVENEKVETTEHKSSKTVTSFHAHQTILQTCGSSSLLCELSKLGGDDVNTVSITDVSPEIFRHLLYYLYGGKITDEELNSSAKDIINAADRYGVVGLKLEAEACYVQSTTITFENAIDNLLYADATNCALLKEAVMDFIAENSKEAVNKLSFENVPSSAMKDLLTAVNRNVHKGSTSADANDFSMMRVSTLRKMLDEKGLDVDGSREAMIARLEQSA